MAFTAMKATFQRVNCNLPEASCRNVLAKEKYLGAMREFKRFIGNLF